MIFSYILHSFLMQKYTAKLNCNVIPGNASREKRNENEFLQDASCQETGRTRTDFMMKEEEK